MSYQVILKHVSFAECVVYCLIDFVFSNGNGNFGKVEEDGGTSNGLIVLAVVFSIFGVLVIIFMIYIVRRVRYRHLYMQVSLTTDAGFRKRQ